MSTKVLFLVLASTNHINVADECVQKKTWGSNLSVTSEAIWLRGSTKSQHYVYCDSDSTLFVPIEEKQENILQKTILGIEWCLKNREFDVLIRTNTSTYYHTRQLELNEFVSSEPKFGGYLEATKKFTKSSRRKKFVTGSGIFLNSESCRLLLSLDTSSYSAFPDDVAISDYMFNQNARFIQVRRGVLHSLGIFIPHPYQRLKSSIHSHVTIDRMHRVHLYFVKQNKVEKIVEYLRLSAFEIKYMATSAKRRKEVFRNYLGFPRIHMLNLMARIHK